MVAVEQLTEPCTFHGEGPYWDRRGGRLLFVDMLAGAVVSLFPGGELSRSTVGSVAAVVRARRDGGFVVGVERGFALTDESLTVTQTLPPVFEDDSVRMNEGGCDPQGRFYCVRGDAGRRHAVPPGSRPQRAHRAPRGHRVQRHPVER
jgi:sugar lactone lactonase YvrE